MARNKCVCDVCGKVIYRDPLEDGPSQVVKYWNANVGVFKDNRKEQKESYELCSLECCMAFPSSQEDNLANPFEEYYYEIIPIKVIGEVEEI